jgi:cyclic beta-1,2-glucan synthetase
MLRVAVEQVLGWRVEGGEGRLRPCVPSDWTEFSILYRLPGEPTRYHIQVTNPAPGGRGVVQALVDGAPAAIEDGAARFPLGHDGAVHRVDVVLG